MPITLDGTVAMESTVPAVTTYPRSYVAFVAGASGLNKFWLPIGQHSADWNSWESAAVDNYTDTKQAITQPPGNSPTIANKSSVPHIPVGTTATLLPIVAVFASASSRTIYFGDNTGVTDNTSVTDVSSALAVLMVGNGLKGQIAEAHVYTSALTPTDVTALLAGTAKPEELAGWRDGWILKDRRSDGVYTSMGGTRQIVVDPTKTSIGTSAHPVARAGSSDTTPPVLTGSLTVGSVTASTIQVTWPTGSDDVGVTSYETSLDGTVWTDRGNVLTYTFSGLSASTSYTPRVRAKDAAGNVSTPPLQVTQSTAAGDTTPPTLSAPTSTAIGPTGATIGVTTNEANGVLYTVVTTATTPPSVPQVIAGQNNGGTSAAYSANQAVSSTGAKTFDAIGLTPSTGYYPYFVHTDAAGNNSTVLAGTGFTTSAPVYGVITTDPLVNNTGSLVPPLTSGWTVYVFNKSTRDRVATITGLATDSQSRLVFTDPSLAIAEGYFFDPYHPTYGNCLPFGTTT